MYCNFPLSLPSTNRRNSLALALYYIPTDIMQKMQSFFFTTYN
jgi:hypothetical protein